ncbi:conserved hypothetical protein [Desulfatibacillum aliphaticivorans]|uniref:Uncharacterized protein n=1 Tax=Desulfatibacillum aliphaticivorans TaxID=218208 RepID=B8FLW4_DESAL|nr:hypothetical protein [Desulfatibacillum aliphaticivorans]ACL05468.1 conserved hypothetical protein [Desulfatibacillum aliphaticivorans]
MDKKKVAAAIGGVMQYLKTEEEALAAAAQAPKPERVNYWGMAGRQASMQMRTLMQMRAFAGKTKM